MRSILSGSASQGYASQGYAPQGYASQGYAPQAAAHFLAAILQNQAVHVYGLRIDPARQWSWTYCSRGYAELWGIEIPGEATLGEATPGEATPAPQSGGRVEAEALIAAIAQVWPQRMVDADWQTQFEPSGQPRFAPMLPAPGPAPAHAQNDSVHYRLQRSPQQILWVQEQWTSYWDPDETCWWVHGAVLEQGSAVDQNTAIDQGTGIDQGAGGRQEPSKPDGDWQSELGKTVSEGIARTILDSAIAAIVSFWVSPTGEYHYLYQSQGCQTLLGYRPTDFWAEPTLWDSRLTPEGQVQVRAAIAQAIATGKSTTVEYQFQHRQGDWRWLASTYTPRPNPEEGGWIVTGVGLDISDRKRAEIARQTSEEALAIAFRANPNPMALTELETGRILELNQRFCDVSGYSRDELLHHSTLDLELWLDPAERAEMRHYLQTDGAIRDRQYRFRVKSGEILTTLVSCEPIQIEDKACLLSIVNDITQRTQIEQDLRESQERLQRLMANVPGMVHRYIQYPDGRIAFAYVSPQCKTLFELSADQIVSYPELFWDRLHPSDVALFERALHTNCATGFPPLTLDARIILPSSRRLKWIRITSQGHQASDGRIIWDGVVADITHQKDLALALQASEAKLSSILNSVGASISRFRLYGDLSSTYDFVSAGCEQVFGYPSQEFSQYPDRWMSRIIPEDLQRFHAQYLDAIFQGKPCSQEYRFRHRNGQVRWISTFMTSQYDPIQQCWLVTTVDVDIHERKQMEETLRETQTALSQLNQTLEERVQERTQALEASESTLRQSEAFLCKIFDEAPMAMAIAETETLRITRANHAMAQMLGYTLTELGGMTIPALSHPEDFLQESALLTACLRGDRSEYHMTKRYLHKNGAIVWGELSYTMLSDAQDEARYGLSMMQDISDRHRADEQLRASLREKEVLLKEIHHRVKNNLQLISSLLNLQAHTIQDPEVLKPFRDCQQRIHVIALIHEQLYRSENLAQIYLPTYLKSLSHSLFQSYAHPGQSIQLDLQVADLHLGLDVAIPCGLIINELVSNAMKYAFPQGRNGTITICFRNNLSPLTPSYTLLVQDDGVGLPEGFCLGQLESLGLQAVGDLTDQLDGALQIQGHPGTKVEITFPHPRPTPR